MNIKLSELRKVNNLCKNLFSEPDFRAVMRELAGEAYDFTVDNVRFIKDSCILYVLTDELKDDVYFLGGCFSPEFIEQQTGLPAEMIEICREAEAFEAIGTAILRTGKLLKLVEEYVDMWGYSDHFNCYDGSSEGIEINGDLYHVFDNH